MDACKVTCARNHRWLIAALLIDAVVSTTFVLIMPTNHRLLALDRDPTTSETRCNGTKD